MTTEEKRQIADCRIAVAGATEFIGSVRTELQQLGFEAIQIISPSDEEPIINTDVIAENVNDGSSCLSKDATIPLILPFDFVNGAGAIVVMPEDERDMLRKPNLRQWAATYMAGYCAFWNIDGYEWLRYSLLLLSGKKRQNHIFSTNIISYTCFTKKGLSFEAM